MRKGAFVLMSLAICIMSWPVFESLLAFRNSIFYRETWQSGDAKSTPEVHEIRLGSRNLPEGLLAIQFLASKRFLDLADAAGLQWNLLEVSSEGKIQEILSNKKFSVFADEKIPEDLNGSLHVRLNQDPNHLLFAGAEELRSLFQKEVQVQIARPQMEILNEQVKKFRTYLFVGLGLLIVGLVVLTLQRPRGDSL